MTGPFASQQAPSQGGWQQVPGGYGQPAQQLPPGLSAMQQSSAFNGLPPQMGGNLLENQQSPLAFVPPNVVQQQRSNPQFQQQQPPQFQQQVQQPAGVGINDRLNGQDVPIQYRGRPVGEVLQMLEGMRQFHFQQQAQAQQQQNQPQRAQPAQGQQPNAGQPQQGAEQQQAGWDWKKPDESIARVVDQRVGAQIEGLFNRLQPMLAPVAASNMMNEAQNARQSAANQIGRERYAQLEPAIMDFLKGADPTSLTNPATWTAAARYVIGDLAMRGVQVPMGQQQNGHQPGAFPVQQVGQLQNPSPNMNSFFSEQPNQGGVGPQGLQLSSEQMGMAQAMGIAPADFAAWAGGIAYSNARNGGQR